MLRFSCFSDINGPKIKKQAQPSFDKMLKRLQVGSQKGTDNSPTHVNRSPAEAMDKNDSTNRGWRSGELEVNTSDVEVPHKGHIRRCVSSTHLQDGRISEENSSKFNAYKEFLGNESHDHYSAVNALKNPSPTSSPGDQEISRSESPHSSYGKESAESGSLGRDLKYLKKEEAGVDFSFQADDEYVSDSGNHTSHGLSGIAKSQSVPNFESISPANSEGSPPGGFEASYNRSFEDLNAEYLPEQNEERNEIQDDWYDYTTSNKDWIVPVMEDEEYDVHNLHGESSSLHGESSSLHGDQMPSKNFKIKRIQEWVIDLPERDDIEETGELLDSHEQLRRPEALGIDGGEAAKSEMKMNPGTVASRRYISSLGASATAAQLANHGLTETPFLSAFVSLKVVNLSGNSIVKITAGSLPRGVHMLNLSKNKISNIEGLRELTRLRILDISYNKITRIGRGLAYCSSLKELYIAGNKISEVEGLHRLLKLTVLDLRFNKISTAKCLGQLAANYNSLHAISLEGNPAQKNVGDDQLKKYLLGLLPHLSFYNRQSTTSKVSSLKESSDRSIRLGGAAHQFDRPLKSDQRSRRSGYVTKQLGHRGQVMGVESRKGGSSRGNSGNLPPTTSSRSHQRHHRKQLTELRMKPLDLAKELAIRKSQSVGSLAAL